MIQAQTDAAREAMNAGNLEAANAAVAIALGGDPKNIGALELKTEIDSKRTGNQVAADESARAAAARAVEQRRQSGPIGNARELFRGGDVKAALAALGQAPAADAAVAAKLQEDMARCNQMFQSGTAAAAAGQANKAVQLLGQTRKLADAILPGSTIASEAGEQLSQLEDKLGFAARTAGKPDEAYRHFAVAHGANARDAQAQTELKRLEGEAHEIFVQAYSARNSDPEAAERKFHQVVGMTPTTSSDHKLAAEWLAKVGK